MCGGRRPKPAEHPGTSVAAKRTLNRLLHSSRFAGVRVAIERACAKVAKLYVPVPAPGTSSMCHRCGGKGIRESQAVFRCPSCGWVGNADFNAAHNVDHRTCTHLSIGWVSKNPAAGAVVVRRSDGRNPSRAPCDASEAISKNTSPAMGTIVYKPQRNPWKSSGVPMPQLRMGRRRRPQRSMQREAANLGSFPNGTGAESAAAGAVVVRWSDGAKPVPRRTV